MTGSQRLEEYIPFEGMESTPKERWHEGDNTGGWYGASTQFALAYLGAGAGRKCLVIGSPVFEAKELRRIGWDTTYLDIRNPPPSAGYSICMDATEIDLPAESFDAVSSACVLTHAGTGRYGDNNERGTGDEMMLAGIVRVLKPGAHAALTFGACVTRAKMVMLGRAHRIYTIGEAGKMLARARLTVERRQVWSPRTRTWTEDAPTENLYEPDYLSFGVRK